MSSFKKQIELIVQSGLFHIRVVYPTSPLQTEWRVKQNESESLENAVEVATHALDVTHGQNKHVVNERSRPWHVACTTGKPFEESGVGHLHRREIFSWM